MSKKRPYSAVADVNWSFWQNDDGTYSTERAQMALLMDIREALKKLNAVMQCPNVGAGFRALIEMNRRDKKEFDARVRRAVARKLKAKP